MYVSLKLTFFRPRAGDYAAERGGWQKNGKNTYTVFSAVGPGKIKKKEANLS